MTIQSRLVLSIAALAISAACSNSKASDAAMVSSSDQRFVDVAVAAGHRQVEYGNLAKDRASSAAVKDYAARVVTAHQAANDELASLVERKHIEVANQVAHDQQHRGIQEPGGATIATRDGATPTGRPSTTGTTGTSGTVATTGEAFDRARAGTLEPWKNAEGAAFDAGYLAEQIKDHADAIAYFDEETKRGYDADLKAFAAKQLPALREHLREAQELQRAAQNP